MSCDIDELGRLLEEKNMRNKDQYKHVIHLSQKLKYQINQLKLKSNTTVQLDKSPSMIQFHRHSTSTRHTKNISLFLQKSPTETLLTHHDFSDKPLPPVKPSSELYPYTSYDSLNTPPLVLPPKSNSFHNKIIHTQKKYTTLMNFLQGTYQLEHIIIYKYTVSPYIYASHDKQTGEKKRVLKLAINMTTPTDLIIEFPKKLKKKRKKDYQILLNDQKILQRLTCFISKQPLLPPLVHANPIFCVGNKLYLVYSI